MLLRWMMCRTAIYAPWVPRERAILLAGDCSAARAFDVTRGRVLVAASADDVPSSARRAASRLGGRTRWADASLAATMGRMMVRPKRPTVAVALALMPIGVP